MRKEYKKHIVPFSNEFSLLKLAHMLSCYYFPDDILKKEFFIFLYDKITKGGITYFLHKEFAKIIFENNAPDFINENDIINSSVILKRKYKISKKWFSPRISYIYFFIPLLAYILELGGSKYDLYTFGSYYKIFKINKKKQQILEQYINLLESGKLSELSSFFQKTKLKHISTIIQPLSDFIINESHFYSLPRKSITLFSTMSSGKSTFINALLGSDYLPSKNEACTAKIATIADNDYIYDYCLGYAKIKNEQVFCGNTDKKTLDNWNKDDAVSEIVLEGNLDRIGSEKIITVIHDTPGINYSGNAEHKKITLEHLIDSRPDLIICLLDATQLHTTDYSDALQNLKTANNKGSNANVLFVINKTDEFDIEKENLKKTVSDTIEYIKKHGFEDPVLIPVSSQAARLFKMALHGNINFTENEIDDFKRFFRFFSRPANNYFLFTSDISEDLLINKEYNIANESSIKNVVEMEGIVYNCQDIKKALFNTGISIVENLLNTWKEKK